MSDFNENNDNSFNFRHTENGEYEEFRQPEKKSRKGLILGILLGAVVLIGIGIGVYFFISGAKNGTAEDPSTEIGAEDPTRGTETGEKKISLSEADPSKDYDITATVMDVSDIVDRVMPTVVAITDSLVLSQNFNPYNFFFGQGGSGTQEAVASGSGVIIAEDENDIYIVTNAHVVNSEGDSTYQVVESKGLKVTFVDETTVSCSVKGYVTEEDLAIVTVSKKDISSETAAAIRIAVIGNSDEIRVGAGVIAIGNAKGYGQSVTAGIISAKNRSVTIDDMTLSLLQTDAAINPGNSGGGLFDASGHLVGINNAKTVSTEIEGMCFAIPITHAESIIEDIMNKETIPEGEEGYLGINGEDVPESYISSYNYPAGVSITRISTNSPAEKAGLQIYDIISEVNGKKVTSMTELKHTTNSYRAGTEVELLIYRPNGSSFKEMHVKVTLAKKSEVDTAPDSKEEENPSYNPFDIWDWLFR